MRRDTHCIAVIHGQTSQLTMREEEIDYSEQTLSMITVCHRMVSAKKQLPSRVLNFVGYSTVFYALTLFWYHQQNSNQTLEVDADLAKKTFLKPL